MLPRPISRSRNSVGECTPGNLQPWDGLTVWFLRQYRERQEFHEIGYLRRWAVVAAAAFSP
jgi:hypothetical protein